MLIYFKASQIYQEWERNFYMPNLWRLRSVTSGSNIGDTNVFN